MLVKTIISRYISFDICVTCFNKKTLFHFNLKLLINNVILFSKRKSAISILWFQSCFYLDMCKIYSYIMTEPAKKKIWKVLLVTRLNGIQTPPAGKWEYSKKLKKFHLTLLPKHAHALKIYFVKSFLHHMVCVRQSLMLGN